MYNDMLDYAANYGLSLSNCVILDQTDERLLNFVNFICQRVWTLCVLVFIAYLVEQKGVTNDRVVLVLVQY